MICFSVFSVEADIPSSVTLHSEWLPTHTSQPYFYRCMNTIQKKSRRIEMKLLLMGAGGEGGGRRDRDGEHM